jgi:mannose-6-phosphate isomerase
MLYPLKFKDVFKEKVWGGEKLRSWLGKDFAPLSNCGEAWVLSGLENEATVVSNGFLAGNTLPELIEVYLDELLGEEVFAHFGTDFPLLFKFIDAHDWLSVQVHPNDSLARERGLPRGKSELWYVLQAEPGSRLISGFEKGIQAEQYLQALEENRLQEILHFVEVKAGDVLYMPAGRIHALGPGILIAEIQQSADTTYRIYDWDRPGQDGKMRALHTAEALDAIDFSPVNLPLLPFQKKEDESIPLVNSPHFVCNLIQLGRVMRKDFEALDRCVVYLCVEGQGRIGWENGEESLQAGEAILIPASMQHIQIHPSPALKLLEVYPA